LPWEEVLDYAGLALTPVKGSTGPWLGIATMKHDGGTVVRTVVAGSPAYEAGIDVGDELLAIDGFRVHADDFGARIADHAVGDTIRVEYFHHDELRERIVKLAQSPVPSYVVHQVDKPSSLQREIYEGWLGEAWESDR
jgi:predicted metalloprotease with PDZ domain